jgi:hypothetical protein
VDVSGNSTGTTGISYIGAQGSFQNTTSATLAVEVQYNLIWNNSVAGSTYINVGAQGAQGANYSLTQYNSYVMTNSGTFLLPAGYFFTIYAKNSSSGIILQPTSSIVITVLTAGQGPQGATGPAGGGGSITIASGTNITASTVGSTTTINLQAPLTSTLNVGSQNITTTTTNGDINMVMNGTGGLTISSMNVAGFANPLLKLTNSDSGTGGIYTSIYKNSTTPAVGDALGVTSYYGNNASSVKTEFANTTVVINTINAPTPTTVVNHAVLKYNTGGASSALTNMFSLHGNYSGNPTILLNPTATNINTRIIGSNASNPAIYVDSATNSVSINSATTGYALYVNGTTYTSGLLLSSNPVTTSGGVELHFERVYQNDGTGNPVQIDPPVYPYQSATLINIGRTVVNRLTQPITASYQLFCCYAFNGTVWVGGSNIIYQINADTVTTTITLSGGMATAYCMMEFNGFLYVGGSFTTVDDPLHTTTIYPHNVFRIDTSGYISLVQDSFGNGEGFNDTCYCMCTGYDYTAGSSTYGQSTIYFGGVFTQYGSGSGGLQAPYRMTGLTAYGAWLDTFCFNCAVQNGIVYAISQAYSNNYSGYGIAVGGSFTQCSATGNGTQSINYLAQFDTTNFNVYSSGMTSPNSLNGTVYCMMNNGNNIYCGGAFTSVSTDSGSASYTLIWDFGFNYTNPYSAGYTSTCFTFVSAGLSNGGDGLVNLNYPSVPIVLTATNFGGSIECRGLAFLNNRWYIVSDLTSTSSYLWIYDFTDTVTFSTASSGLTIKYNGSNFTNVAITFDGNVVKLISNQAMTTWYVVSQNNASIT